VATLSEDQIDLLRDSLRVMQARKQLLADIFYERLFEIDPSVRPLFSDDILAQTDKVIFAFGAVMAQIHDVDACREMTCELALRHVDYGVQAAHYATVRRAVMRTLEEVFAEDFTPELAHAWGLAYDRIAAAMIASAYGPPAADAA
jgi:hemoglobin-like flavoprotein